MEKKTYSTKKMLMASIVVLAACTTLGVQVNAVPTPAGTNPTYSFGAEQDGAGSAANQVSYIGSDGAIKHAIVNIATQTPKYWLDQSNTGSMNLLGTRYDVSAASLDGVNRYSTYDSVHENAGQLVNGSPYLIANIDNVAGTIYFSTLTENKNINVDFLNNKFSANVGGFDINSDKDNPVTVNITSNIIGNSGPTDPENYGNTNNIYYLKNGNFNFQGDIIGNNFTTKYENNGIIRLSVSNGNDNNTLNFTGNVLGNNLVSTEDYVSGGIINDNVASGKTSTIEGIFANNYASGYKGLNGGVLRIGAAENSTVTVKNSLFSGNTAALSTNNNYIHGGVIYSSAAEGANVNIVNTDFVNNKNERITDHNSSDSGMVIYHTGDGTLNITDSNFVGNTTNSKYSSHVIYSAGDVVVNAQNEDVLFSDNTRTNAETGKIYDIYLSNNDKSLTLNASDGHSITLTNGINATTLNVNTGSGATGTVITKLPNSNIDVLNLNAGTLNVLANDADPNLDTRVSHMYVGAAPTIDLRNDTIDSLNLTYTGAEPALALYGSTTSANVKLNIDYDGSVGTYGSADKLSFSDEAKVADNITVTLNDVNVISDSAFDAVSGNINYVAGKYTNVNGENYLGEVTQANAINVVSSGGYTYHFFTGGTYNNMLNFTREYTGAANSLPAVIQDATTNSFSVSTDGFNAFEGTAYTSLGAINTGKNSFTINGSGRGIDGNYGSTPTKGGGVTVGSGQTLNLNNVNTSNFSTFATTTMADADNKGTINVLGGASSSAANVYDNNLDFMNDGNLNFTGGYVTLNGGISNSLSTAVNAAKNGSTTIQEGAHVTLGSNAVLAQNNLTIGSGGEFTASTDQLNGIGQLAGSSVHNISNQGTLNISAGSNTLTTRINDTGSSTGTIRLLGDITSSSTVRAANLDLNGNTYTLGSSGAKLFLLGAENGSIVANNTGDMQLTSPGSSTIDITDVTIDGLAYITLDGRIKADASKIMNIGNDIRLYSGTKLTLIGDTNTSSFVDFAGNGDVTIADSMANSGTFANHSLTINAKDSENNTISFTTDADKLQTETAITNGGRLVLTGNVVQDADNSGLLSQSISGDGTTVIDGNIVLDSSKIIDQNIEITAGGNSLDAYVNKFTGNVSVGGQVGNTGDYSSIILHGTSTDTPYEFNQSITGDGYAEISNDLNLSLGSNGSISNVLNNGILTAALTQVGSVENNGTFNTNGTMNGRTIAGANGTTTLDGTLSVTGATASTIAGILNMNGQTINMQDQNLDNADPANVYPAEASPIYSTLNVGSLQGTGNLKIDVNMANGTSDNVNITDGSANSGTITVSSVNVYEPDNLDNTNHENYISYVTGATTGVTFNDTTVSTITSDNHRYIFSNGDAGKLNVKVLPSYATLSEFVQGDIEGKLHPEEITATGYSLVDDLTVDTALGTVSREAYNTAHQSVDPEAPNYDPNVPISELSIFVNNHTLSGTSTTSTVEYVGEDTYGSRPDEYEWVSGSGDDAIYHHIDNTDPLNPVYETETTKTQGVTVADGYTLNISGTDADNKGTMTNFDTAVTVEDGGVVNIENMILTGNDTDIVNDSYGIYDDETETYTVPGLIFTGTNEVDTIEGEGTTAVVGNLNVREYIEQDGLTVAQTGSLTVDADALSIDDGFINNAGKIHLGEGETGILSTKIHDATGTTYIDGDITSNARIGQDIVIAEGKTLTIDAGNVGSTDSSTTDGLTVTNEAGTLILTGGNGWFPARLNSAVEGDGQTVIDGHIANWNIIENQVIITEDGTLDTGAEGLQSEDPTVNDGNLNLYNSTSGTTEEKIGQDIAYDTTKGTTTIYGDILNDGHTIANDVVNNNTFKNDEGEIDGDVTNNGTFTNEDGEIIGDVDNNSTFTNDGGYIEGDLTNGNNYNPWNPASFTNTNGGEVSSENIVNNGNFTNEEGSSVNADDMTNNAYMNNEGEISGDTLDNNAFLNNTGDITEQVSVTNDGMMYNNGDVAANELDNSGALYNGVEVSFDGTVTASEDGGTINANIDNTGLAYNDGKVVGDVENNGGTLYNGVETDENGNLVSTDTSGDKGVIEGSVYNLNEMTQAVDEEGNPVVDEEGNPVMEVEDVADFVNGGKIEGEKVVNTGNFSNGVYQTQAVDEEGNPVVDEDGNPVMEDHLLADAEIVTDTLENSGNYENATKIEAEEIINDGVFVNSPVTEDGEAEITLVDDSGDAGTFTNKGEGILVNDGAINGNVSNNNDAVAENNGEINGDVKNYDDAIAENNGEINGDVSNHDNGEFTNNGDINGWADNYDDGTFTNNGTIDTTQADDDQYVINEGTYTNNGDIVGGIDNDGNFINNGTIDSTTSDTDSVENYGDGTFINNGDVATGNVDNSADMENNGNMTAETIENSGEFVNTGDVVADTFENNDGQLLNGVNPEGENIGGGTISADVENDGFVGNAGVIDGNVTSSDDGDVSLLDGGEVTGNVTGGDLSVDRGDAKVGGDVDVNSLSVSDALGGGLGTLTVGGTINSDNFYTDGGTLNTQNGKTTTSNLGDVLLANTMNFELDADILNNVVDAITGSYNPQSNPNATINISNIKLLADDKTAGEKRLDMFAGNESARAALKDHFSSSNLDDFLVNPIFKYSGSYDSTDGMLVIDKRFNPAVLVAPVAAQLGGYANQLNSYDEAFRNMDMYMLMTKSQRQALKLRNKYASIDSSNKIFDPTMSVYDSASGWFRPYATFESVRLRRGPKVSNVAYGSYFGGESEMKDLGHGWDGMWGAYVGYNGSHQTFEGNSIYQNGGTLGLVGMAYKNNFFTGLTINAGANAAEANTMYGHENFAMLMAGVASKTGYNWELADGKFIIQPSALVSYSFVNTFDYTNAAGVRVSSDPLHAIQIEPGIKFIGNLKNGWQPYAGISVVWNIMDRTHFKANDVSLPNMSIRPFVKYGVGIRKTWGEKFTAFFQTYFTNGGRNGVGLQAGLRWNIGKDPKQKKNGSSNSNKTVLKSMK